MHPASDCFELSYRRRLVEAAGIEPASEEAEAQVSTCVVPGGILPLRSPGTDADERPARKVSRVEPGHAPTASSQ